MLKIPPRRAQKYTCPIHPRAQPRGYSACSVCKAIAQVADYNHELDRIEQRAHQAIEAQHFPAAKETATGAEKAKP